MTIQRQGRGITRGAQSAGPETMDGAGAGLGATTTGALRGAMLGPSKLGDGTLHIPSADARPAPPPALAVDDCDWQPAPAPPRPRGGGAVARGPPPPPPPTTPPRPKKPAVTQAFAIRGLISTSANQSTRRDSARPRNAQQIRLHPNRHIRLALVSDCAS